MSEIQANSHILKMNNSRVYRVYLMHYTAAFQSFRWVDKIDFRLNVGDEIADFDSLLN